MVQWIIESTTRWLAAATVVLAACASRDVAPIATTTPEELAAEGPVEIAWSQLRRDVSVEYPTVQVSIEGYTLPLLLDTGANTHLLVPGVAWYLDLDGERSLATARGAHGADSEVSLVQEVSLRVLRWPAGPPARIAIGDLPVRSRLLGFLSPQALVADGAARIDFRTNEMIPVPRGELARAVAREDAVRLTPICRTSAGVALFVVDADIGGVKGAFIVDSGSGTTGVFGGSEVGRALAPRARPDGTASASLGSVEETSSASARVRVAGLETTTNVSLIDVPARHRCASDAEGAPISGHLGLDVLRRCTVVIAKDEATLSCGG